MNLPAITVPEQALSRFDQCIRKEWLVTNGLGGYASSTVMSVNTRKYHGLLVAALHPPGDRTVCLAKLDEEASVDKNIYPLGANEFQSKIFPQGYLSLKEFKVSPFPRYLYSLENATVEKTIFMPKERNATVVIYNLTNNSDSETKLKIYPLLSCRHFHSVVDRRQNPLEFTQTHDDKEVELAFANPKASVALRATSGAFTTKPNWLDRLLYREEAARGESSMDDCYQPGYFEVAIPPKRQERFAIVAAASETSEQCRDDLDSVGFSMYDVDGLTRKEQDAPANMVTGFYSAHRQLLMNDWLNWLLLAGDAFVVKGADGGKSIIAGYYWFEAWGRDTFISLPGLLLTTGRFEDAKKIFVQFASHSKQGLIPNYIQDRSGEPAYNTADATLWYVNAVLQYLKYTGDYKFVQKQLWDALKAIVDFHEKGTSNGIRMDGDGLLTHGPQLTWMDAALDGNPVTPRAGKAVEIQALWYNALRTMQLLAGKLKEPSLAEKYAAMANKARESFNLKFWNSQANCLFDVLAESGADGSLRPNQIIAVSLDFAVLDNGKREQVVDAVNRELLTPFGLRTLARSDYRYRGMYVGDRWSRDQSYHNGTAWPWLLGPFTTAFLKAKGHADYRVQFALENCLLPLFTQQPSEAGLGTLSEIFDGEPPHAPRGCVAQAWSVAEPLRAYVEDVMQVKPPYEREALQL
jgi:predicted glycogen debranching enzyme